MSVSVDKYFGWTIDLKTDLNCNDFDFYHKLTLNKYVEEALQNAISAT